jgi:hypothetical protein
MKSMLTKEKILKYFNLLNDELKALDIHGELLLAGGASMCLVHEARDMTKDIDALYEPKSLINQIVKKIAIRENIQENWLNDAVKAYIIPDTPIDSFLNLGNLVINTVSPNYLLAMKMMASRYGEHDYDDIIFLLRKLHISTIDEAIDSLLTFFSPEQILPKTQFVIQQAIEKIHAQNAKNPQPEKPPLKPKL